MRRLRSGFSILLLFAATFMLGFIGLQYRTQWDLTQNGRHSLSETTIRILGHMEGPVRITSYASRHDSKFGNVQQSVSDFLAPYMRIKPDISVRFVDPGEEPKLAEGAGVQANGEMIVEYGKKSGHLLALNEESLDNLMIRLSRKEDRLVMALAGHGERKLDGIANFDLGEFGRRLVKNGFRTGSLNLALAQDVPQNMNLLVIASPQIDLFPGEVKKLEAYLERGGNILWLIDQGVSSGEPLHGLQPLADKLGLSLTPGTVVDPAASKLNAPADWALGTLYGAHPVTRNFNLITVFPFARQIGASENSPWHVTPLVDVAPQGWLSGRRNPAFDRHHDVHGPVTVALAMERTSQGRDQRIAVVGTGEFLANAFIGNGGNMDFGVNLVNWLAGDEKLISLQPKATLDSSMLLTKMQATVMAIGLLFGLPLIFIAVAAFIGWRRR
ncbi:MAG: GldG family protein [Burkholderiales bacterium]|nr:GldG family protein [Burkholderiales bacterium]